jgi:hypothetical protein
MARTNSTMVIDNLKSDFVAGSTLTRPITIANLITNRVNACATRKGYTLSTAELLEIETQLASHYYTRSDRLYKERETDRARGVWLYNNKNPEPYLANAIELDPSGCVNAIVNGKRAEINWLGKDEPDQIDYEDRN